MRQNRCQKKRVEMTAAEYVEYAAGIARRMEEAEARGPGDLPNARDRLARRYGLAASFFYSLRYRPPKSIAVDVFNRLNNAYQAECARQARLWSHERSLARARGDLDAIDTTLLGAADWLVRQETEEIDG